MEVCHTELPGVEVISRFLHRDDRGTFSRIFGREDLAAVGLSLECVQVNHSVSNRAGTVRGLHLQYAPYAETKLVACAIGAIFDVAVDLRQDSPTFMDYFSTVLRGNDGRSVMIPAGCAHGFISLEPATHVVYVASATHAADYEDGIRYDDPLVAVDWPLDPIVISEKDAGWAPLDGRLKKMVSRIASGARD